MSWRFVEVRLENFRCFDELSLEFAPHVNVISGGNGSGKTSVLEALYFLGRGTSFRAARADAAIRQGADASTVFGRLGDPGPGPSRVGVELSRRAGSTVRVDGAAASRSQLARAVPIQLFDPSSHALVQGAPEVRRQFLDWGAFHVEPFFFENWQRYRRVLQQRNAALRSGASDTAWAWDGALAQAGEAIAASREQALAAILPGARALSRMLLEQDLEGTYLRGWPADESLDSALRAGRGRDQAMGSTQVGPHRGDVRIEVKARRARDTVSRGQEKLVAAAMALAQIEKVAEHRGHPVALLVDEPGADLDREHLGRLQTALWATPAQVFVTTLDPALLSPPPASRVFHVEHGKGDILV